MYVVIVTFKVLSDMSCMHNNKNCYINLVLFYQQNTFNYGTLCILQAHVKYYLVIQSDRLLNEKKHNFFNTPQTKVSPLIKFAISQQAKHFLFTILPRKTILKMVQCK